MIVREAVFNLDRHDQHARRERTTMNGWLDRSAALARLGVRAQTLYAYVSRGRVAMRPAADDPRRSEYSAADVEALARRRARGRRASAIAASTIAWGEPTLATSISTVRRGRPVYRGVDAVGLAESATLEEAATLLWDADAPVCLAARRGLARPVAPSALAALRDLAALAAAACPTVGRSVDELRADAEVAVATLARALGAADGRGPIHVRVARGWARESRPSGRATAHATAHAADALRRALVLLADHELNASTFAARVAASTGASIAACLLAGLAALSGPRHGGAAAAAAALADDAARLGSDVAVARWLERGASLPGFGHPLYPGGDPRAQALLATIEPDDALTALRDAVADATDATDATDAAPNVDFALLALVRAHGLPVDAPFRLFALGRSVGWAAHAMEQALSGEIIRPRARYEGA
jgi:citrate synthase